MNRVSFSAVIPLYFILNCLAYTFCCMFVCLIHLCAETETYRAIGFIRECIVKYAKICIWHCLSPYSLLLILQNSYSIQVSQVYYLSNFSSYLKCRGHCSKSPDLFVPFHYIKCHLMDLTPIKVGTQLIVK